MRVVSRFLMLSVVAGVAWSQALTDAAGVIAGGSVGAGAGKKVSEGITNVLNKVNGTTTKAAKTPEAKTEKIAHSEKPADKRTETAKAGNSAVLQVGPGGVVKDHSLVPPPPPKKVIAVVPPPPPLIPPTLAVFAPVPALPPPPRMTSEDLKTLAGGTSRAEVLKLGTPASRVTMFDDGHLVEIYRYQDRDITLGVVRLSDGSVSSVQVR